MFVKDITNEERGPLIPGVRSAVAEGPRKGVGLLLGAGGADTPARLADYHA